jgi:hypothetical protein
MLREVPPESTESDVLVSVVVVASDAGYVVTFVDDVVHGPIIRIYFRGEVAIYGAMAGHGKGIKTNAEHVVSCLSRVC